MDRQSPLTAKLDPNDLEKVPGVIRTDSKHTRRISVGLDIDDDEGVSHRVLNGVVGDPVLVGRSVDLHTCLS